MGHPEAPVVRAGDQRARKYAWTRASVFAGFFVWRVYGDPDDVSQEAEWGFSPRGKLAELIVRDAFRASWASDPTRTMGLAPGAEVPGIWP